MDDFKTDIYNSARILYYTLSRRIRTLQQETYQRIQKALWD